MRSILVRGFRQRQTTSFSMTAGALAFVMAASGSALAQGSGVAAEGDAGGSIEELSLESMLSQMEIDERLQEYATVATKVEQPVQLIPASVRVITKEQLANNGWRSIGEALGSMPGIFMTYDLVNYNVALRGALGGARSAGRLLKIMIDGVPVPFAQTETYLLGPEFLPISMVESIEVLYGPASSLYGAGAFAGAINVVTKRQPYEGELAVHGELRASGAAMGQSAAAGEAVLSVTDKKLAIVAAFSGAWDDRSGYALPTESPYADDVRYVPAGDPLESTKDYSQPRSLFANARLNLAGGLLSASGIMQVQDSSAEFHDLTVFSSMTRSRTRNWVGNVGYERPIGDSSSLKFNANVSGGGPLEGDQFYLGTRVERAAVADADYVVRDFDFRKISGSAEYRFEFENQGFVLGGLDYYTDTENLAHYVSVDLATQARDDTFSVDVAEESLTNFAGYVQGVYPFAEFLTLAAQFRGDSHSVVGFQWAGRFAALMPLGSDLVLKAIFGKSLKAPSPEQLYAIPITATAYDVIGKDDLEPQTMLSGELVADYYPTETLNVTASLYFNQFDNVLGYRWQSGRLTPTNYKAGNVGAEFVARTVFDLASRVSLTPKIAVAYQNLTTEEKEQFGLVDKAFPDNEGVPKMIISGSLDLDMKAFYSHLSLQFRNVGERTPSQSNLALSGLGGANDMTEPAYMLGGYSLLDVAWSSTPIAVGDTVTISGLVRVANALGAEYSEIGFNGVDVPSIGRSGWAELRVAF